MDAVVAELLVKERRKVKAYCDPEDRHQRRRVGEYQSSVLTIMSAKGLPVTDISEIIHRIAYNVLSKRIRRPPEDLRFLELIKS